MKDAKTDKKKTVLVIVLVAAFLWGLYLSRDSWIVAPDKNNYFSGLLVSGEISKCGIMQKLMMDRFSCRLPREFCFEHEALLNKRVRIGALPERCDGDSPFKCSLNKDFYQPDFIPTHCFQSPTVIKLLDP